MIGHLTGILGERSQAISWHGRHEDGAGLNPLLPESPRRRRSKRRRSGSGTPKRKQRDREAPCGADSNKFGKQKRKHLHRATTAPTIFPGTNPSTPTAHRSSPLSTWSASLLTAPTRRLTGEASMDLLSHDHYPQPEFQGPHASPIPHYMDPLHTQSWPLPLAKRRGLPPIEL